MNPPVTRHWRNLRRCLAGFIGSVLLIALFYAEENWRGQRAWDDCKRTLKAQGIQLDWASYIPARVPDDENVFGVPEMQRWFAGGGGAGWKNLTRKVSSPSYPGANIDSHTPRMLVAELAIGLPGMPAPNGSVALRWDDPASRTEAASLLTNALGPTATTPQSLIGVGLMLRRPEEIQPARIFLQCQATPTEKDLQNFLPDAILHVRPDLPERVLKFEPDGHDSYRVTIPVLARVDDCLAWSDKLEPQFELIRQAVQRPYLRMVGAYWNPEQIPSPNFITVRNLAQTLAARAECHFLLGQPAEALRDLTLMQDICRPLAEKNKPMTLVAAMFNVSVTGLYAAEIADGLRLQAWHEPQLAALEEQLETINVLLPMKEAFKLGAAATCHALETTPSAGLRELFLESQRGKISSWTGLQRAALGLFPRGWGYQNLVNRVNFYYDFYARLDATNQTVWPDREPSPLSRWSPCTFAAALAAPDFNKACQIMAHHQTLIHQAKIACALERYRLAHGEYPETLDVLAPQFIEKIPQDVMSSHTPHYRRNSDGTFILYSAGWNERDNRGLRGQPFQFAEGDWVWPD